MTGSVFAQLNRNSAKKLTRGQEAVSNLSDRLPAVAAKYGKSANKLRRLLLQDPALHVDENDRLLYIDEAPEVQESVADDETFVPKAGPFPNSQTFALHSRPGSTHVIYLDFDGYVTSATAWNNSYGGGTPINSAPFSIDTDPTTFNQQEQDTIQYIWQRVAEDYAAFDVDVTTEDPGDAGIFRSGSTDQAYGSRVVISPTNFTNQSIGGIAYVGVFNYAGTFYKPAFVMSGNLNSAKNIAEATSHEVGHNLGLDHDGTPTAGYYSGHGDWAPIMGVGYYKTVTQWSKGEYTGANNQQDDLAIIHSYGAPILADDYGDSAGSASVLSGTNISVSGLITTRQDVDVFRFTTGSGNVSINLSPAPLGGNLDIEAKISDSAGNVVAVSNPAGLAASFNQYLAAGTYYLTVDGAGFGDTTTGYSDYASIGQYSIAGTLVAGGTQQQAPVASVSANVTSGTTPLTVAFVGSNSADADGYIARYNWSFGDGTANSSEPNPVHVYYSAGTFTATLTVTDNAGLTNSKSVQITATQAANQLPVAIAGASTTSGYASLAVNFSSANSYDPDGYINGYSWNFGNGATSTQANPSYVYNTPGVYTAILTVTDNRGASSASSVVVNVLQQQAPSNVIYIGNLSMSLVQSNRAAQAVVTVYDNNGARRAGVTVTGNWSGLLKGSASGVTDANGQVVLTSLATKKRGTFTINISNLSAPGYTYNPTLSSATRASITN
ncbi:MAG TPA: PKD domain-containing protein [Pyrinomonadaceae bacterium]